MFRTLCRFRFSAATTALTATGLLLIASIGQSQVAPPPPGPPAPEAGDEQPGMETLTQGPIHEAFANPSDMDPTPGPVVATEPPQPIAEEPPQYMPEGAVWVPGYWQWDDDRDQFIWITGVARVPPPKMQWVPGYFASADGGWQRVSGFWASAEEPEIEYRLTGPPQTLEAGPSSPAPSEEHFWVPGYWNYYDTGYRWHGGYWAPYVENWVWVPARWVWTPGGFVFCPGFWDHRLAYRGHMFAPVYFQQPIYTRPAFVYRPWCVIPTNNLFIHLWIRPRWNCYYFGNYYAPQFAQRGFVPWANLTIATRDRYFYDPFFSYARVHYHRQGVDYIGRVQGWHRYFAQHEDLRPPLTWRQQQQFLARGNNVRVETQLVARTVVDVARRQDTALRVVRLDEQSFRTQQQHAERLRDFNQQRRQLEVSARQTAGGRTDDDRRGDDRDGRGPGSGKAGSLVDRAEGTAGRDDKGGGPRVGTPPKLTIPRDLVASTPTVGRGRDGDDGRGDANRGKAGKTAGGPQIAPPRPRPTSTAARDDDRGGKGKAGDDRLPKGVTKAADRQEAPPTLDARDRGAGKVADRDDSPSRGKAGDAGGKPGRDAAGAARTPDLIPGAGRTPDVTPGAGRGKTADRDDAGRPGGAKGNSGRTPGTTFGPRPSAGVEPPAGTITPGTINPDRLGNPGGVPGSNRTPPGRDRNDPSPGRASAPGIDRGPGAGRATTPGLDRGGSPFGGQGRTDRPDTPRINSQSTPPGRGNDAGRSSPFIPKSSVPSARPDSGNRGNDNRGSDNRGNDNRGKGNSNRDSNRPDRTEAFRPNLNRETPTAAMPRVEPRVEARAMPRVEPPRESRPMPRVEPPRENRPTSSESSRGRGKGRDRDN